MISCEARGDENVDKKEEKEGDGREQSTLSIKKMEKKEKENKLFSSKQEAQESCSQSSQKGSFSRTVYRSY